VLPLWNESSGDSAWRGWRLSLQLAEQFLELRSQAQWLQVGVFFEVSQVLVALLERLLQGLDGLLGVPVRQDLALSFQKLGVILCHSHWTVEPG
jgi:hypothetical protein